MDVPEKNDPIWEALVTGKKTCSLRFLAAKILLGRLVRSVAADRSPENIRASAESLQAMFANNLHTPSAKDDLRVILDRDLGREAASHPA